VKAVLHTSEVWSLSCIIVCYHSGAYISWQEPARGILHTIVCLLSLAGAVKCLARGCDRAPPLCKSEWAWRFMGKDIGVVHKE